MVNGPYEIYIKRGGALRRRPDVFFRDEAPPLVSIPQYQPGAEVAVKIHPTDPSKVELDRRGE